MFSISHDFNYILYENQIYDIKEDRVLREEEMTYDFWLNFIKENLVSTYIHEIMDETKVKSMIREITAKFSRNISESFNTIHTLKVEKILSVDLTKENISEVVDESFKLFNKDNLITESEFNENWFTDAASSAWEGAKKIGNSLKELGIDKFFEGLRSALFSWGGIALQTFLTATGALTGGIGPAINMIVWGAMLIYDLSNSILENDWGFDSIFNIVIDIIGVVTTGPGAGAVAKLVGGSIGKFAAKGAQIVKAAGTPIKGAAGKFVQVFAGLSKTSVGRVIGKVVTWLTTKLSSLFSRLGKAANWFKEKFGSSLLKRGIDKVNSFLTKISDGLTRVFTVTKSGAQAVSKASTNTMSKGLQSAGVKKGSADVLAKGAKSAAVQGGVAAGIITAVGGDTSMFGDGGESAMAMKQQKEIEQEMIALGVNQFDNIEMTQYQLQSSSDEAYDELSDV